MRAALDRRQVLRTSLGALVGLALPAHAIAGAAGEAPAGEGTLFASACRDRQGRLAAMVFDTRSGQCVCSLELPERGHGIAVRPADPTLSRPREIVTFARRPGNFGVVLDLDGQRPPLWLTTRADRHFYGHGIYSPDGRLLYTTENDFESGRGIIGVRDADDGYRQIGELPSGGIDPHEVAILSDGRTLVAANGGILTHPDEPRYENTADMQPGLAYIDSVTGDVLERHELMGEQRKLSVRHLAIGAEDTVVFGCQWRGAPWQMRANVGRHRRGASLELLALTDALNDQIRNYVASVGVDRRGETAVITAPKGDLAVLIEVATGRALSTHRMVDVFGVAPEADGFLVTGGDGGMAHLGGEHWSQREARRQDLVFGWDNHLVAVR